MLHYVLSTLFWMKFRWILISWDLCISKLGRILKFRSRRRMRNTNLKMWYIKVHILSVPGTVSSSFMFSLERISTPLSSFISMRYWDISRWWKIRVSSAWDLGQYLTLIKGQSLIQPILHSENTGLELYYHWNSNIYNAWFLDNWSIDYTWVYWKQM